MSMTTSSRGLISENANVFIVSKIKPSENDVCTRNTDYKGC